MSITDGSVICNLCGEPRTRCGLCEGQGNFLIPNPDWGVSADRAEQIREERQIERSIRLSAMHRRGEI